MSPIMKLVLTTTLRPNIVYPNILGFVLFCFVENKQTVSFLQLIAMPNYRFGEGWDNFR